MNKLLIKNSRIVLENEIIKGNILIEEGIIKEISSENIKVNDKNIEIINAKGNYIIPGFIDVHIHGSNGSDVMDGTKEAIINISIFIVKKGVTNFLATTLMYRASPNFETETVSILTSSVFSGDFKSQSKCFSKFSPSLEV